jgi:hypothetical protein
LELVRRPQRRALWIRNRVKRESSPSRNVGSTGKRSRASVVISIHIPSGSCTKKKSSPVLPCAISVADRTLRAISSARVACRSSTVSEKCLTAIRVRSLPTVRSSAGSDALSAYANASRTIGESVLPGVYREFVQKPGVETARRARASASPLHV